MTPITAHQYAQQLCQASQPVAAVVAPQPDPLDSPISKVCSDCRNVQWCIPTRQCLLSRLEKSRGGEEKREASAPQTYEPACLMTWREQCQAVDDQMNYAAKECQ